MSRRPRHHQPTRPFRSVESQLTPDDLIAIEEASAAELAGDWRIAHERHRSVSMFAESPHGADLGALAALGDDAPGWLVSRFVTSMAHRLELYGQPRRSGRVLQTVVPRIYPDAIRLDVIGCAHPEQIGSTIMGRDWVVRQADVHDLGGLDDLLSDPDALGATTRAEHLEAWADAPMGGWVLVGTDGEVLRVADAATGAKVDVLDLGVTEQVPLGGHVLARVVPTATAPGRVFDWRPLPVDAATARLVARHPDQWLSVVAARRRSGALADGFSHLSDTTITADLPRHAWAALLGHDADGLPQHPAALAQPALEEALRLAADDPSELRRRRHLVAELLLDELLDDTVLHRCATPPHRQAWHTLAATVPSYASRRCADALWLIEGMAG